MKVEKIWFGKENYSAVLIALLLRVEKFLKCVAVETYFPCIYTIKKIREERLGGGWLSERPSVASYSRKIFQVMWE